MCLKDLPLNKGNSSGRRVGSYNLLVLCGRPVGCHIICWSCVEPMNTRTRNQTVFVRAAVRGGDARLRCVEV